MECITVLFLNVGKLGEKAVWKEGQKFDKTKNWTAPDLRHNKKERKVCLKSEQKIPF